MEKLSASTIKSLGSANTETRDASFTLIFEKYRHLVYYVSFDIIKNEEDAKDIVNETFLKMFQHRKDIRNEVSLKYFLLVTAKNLSINRYHQNQSHLDYSDDLEGTKDEGNVSLYLEKFKEVLDAEEYQYVVLHLLYDFSFREIAKANCKTTSMVSSKYRRGIQKLRDFYGGDLR